MLKKSSSYVTSHIQTVAEVVEKKLDATQIHGYNSVSGVQIWTVVFFWYFFRRASDPGLYFLSSSD